MGPGKRRWQSWAVMGSRHRCSPWGDPFAFNTRVVQRRLAVAMREWPKLPASVEAAPTGHDDSSRGAGWARSDTQVAERRGRGGRKIASKSRPVRHEGTLSPSVTRRQCGAP